MYFSKVRKLRKQLTNYSLYDERKVIEYFIVGVSCEILQIKEEKFMSMKRVLAAFMGVTLMVGNGPVSVLAEETEQAAEAASGHYNCKPGNPGTYQSNRCGRSQSGFFLADGVWSRSVRPRRHTRSWYRIRDGNVVWDSGVVESSQSNEDQIRRKLVLLQRHSIAGT